MPKAISLYAPWAVAVALGEKKIETRSWSTDYRGEIYIHATKHTPIDVLTDNEHNIILKSVMESYLDWEQDSVFSADYILPKGKIIAKANLIDCVKVKRCCDDCAHLEHGRNVHSQIVQGKEFRLGDYTPGRYAWILDKVVMLDKPIPAKGKQRIWTFDMEGVE